MITVIVISVDRLGPTRPVSSRMGQLGHIMGAGCGGGPQPGERRCRGEGRWRGCERADGASDGEQSWGVCVTDFTRKRLYLVTVLRKLTSVYFLGQNVHSPQVLGQVGMMMPGQTRVL